MSYDLHGIWDKNNPIGVIVQGQSNLTEIQLAAQLLWRVGVKPEQVSLGFGFYDRSFELADPRSSTPGCAFSGGACAGPCSDTSGVLIYYEIQAILNQIEGLELIHDEKAAVKYIVFDDDQWVSPVVTYLSTNLALQGHVYLARGTKYKVHVDLFDRLNGPC